MLSGDSLLLGGDAGERQRALEAVLEAWQAGSPDLPDSIARVDQAIVAGLSALGLPRGLLRELRIEVSLSGWFARKDPSCDLLLAGDRLQATVRQSGRPDTMFRTWVHESLHARQPYSPQARIEYRSWSGYEEGLAEGLARLVTIEKAGMTPLTLSYDYYIAAYRALGTVLNVEPEQFWRGLWRFPPGEVRAGFGEVIDSLWRQRGESSLSVAQHARLVGVADQLFSSSRVRFTPDENVLVALWRAALR